jgi:peptidoglycan glycosyltransferase
MALRQPGSTFKLFPYLVALERGATPGDPVECGALRWRGQTFTSDCSGSLTLVSAFARSSNTAALRLAQRVGLEAVVQKARDLGITSPLDPVPGLALGQSEVTLLELTAAYAAIANDGTWLPPTTIRKVVDGETCRGEEPDECRRQAEAGGRATPAPAAPAGRQAVTRETARRMQQLMRAVVRSGTGTAASLGGQEGGKTGTTNENRDLLFVGYDADRNRVIGIWLGNDDNSPTGATSALAAGLWGEIMRSARS